MNHFTNFSFSIEGAFEVQTQRMTLKLQDGQPKHSRVDIDIPANPERRGDAQHWFWRDCWDYCRQKSSPGSPLFSDFNARLSELEFGHLLFDTFVKGELRRAFDQTIGLAQHQAQNGFRMGVILPKLENKNATFHHIPWELLAEPYANNKRFFLMHSKRSLVRVLETETGSQCANVADEIDGPLRILVVQASADVQQPLASLAEERQVIEALAHDGVVEVESLRSASFDQLVEKLSQKTWHILHFSGHASVDEQHSCFNFVHRFMPHKSDPRSMQQLGAAIEGHGVRLVVMNVCGSTLHPDRESFHAAPLCQLLSCSDVPAMIYPRFHWKRNFATLFANAFYRNFHADWHVEKGLWQARDALQNVTSSDWHFLALYTQHHAFKVLPSLLKSKAAKRPERIEVNDPHLRLFNMLFLRIPSGDGVMGSTPGAVAAVPDDEMPLTQVRVRQAFYMAQTPLTCGQFDEVTRLALKQNIDLPLDWDTYALPGEGNQNVPLTGVSFDRAETILGVMRQLNPSYGFRLPSEAEWEYAARAGSSESHILIQRKQAWLLGPASAAQGFATLPEVRQSNVNAFGLIDMLGLVWEWCGHAYQGYPGGSVTDWSPQDPSALGVLRGGSLRSSLLDCRFAKRLPAQHFSSEADFGLRPMFCVEEAVLP